MFLFTKKNHFNLQKGFTLIEIIVGLAVFLILSLSIYQAYISLLETIRASRLKVVATALANEQFEIIRNLPYTDVGIVGGLPSGKIQQNQTLTRDNTEFSAKTNIRNIDDPFDGTIGGNPNDLSPADYKFVELEVSCSSCKNFRPLSFTTNVAPKNLEGASVNGALFIQVFDANGQPVQGANVHVANNQASPPFAIDDTTNNNGLLQIVDTPPGVGAYEIIVSKQGYSQEKTYAIDSPENPNPTKPHASVAEQQATQISFAIDKTSSLNVTSATEICSPVGNIAFSLKGTKLIGADPDILKYAQNYATNSSGIKNINGLEWDTYNFSLNDNDYDIIGAIPLLPSNLGPDTEQNLKLVIAPKNPLSLLVTVKDVSTHLPLSGANVTLEKTGYNNSLVTGRGFLIQTDWSGGAGQENFIDRSKYFDSDGNIDIDNPSGELRLKKTFDEYESSGNLISSTFDTGPESNFYQILWKPQDQPPETGSDNIKFQIATNSDTTNWNFLGPDGTPNTFYTLANANINPIHSGDRYLRYKIFLQTADTNFTPNIAEVAFTFSSLCVPSGQVIFTGLTSGDYTLTVLKSGYQTSINTVNISTSWQQNEVILNPSLGR